MVFVASAGLKPIEQIKNISVDYKFQYFRILYTVYLKGYGTVYIRMKKFFKQQIVHALLDRDCDPKTKAREYEARKCKGSKFFIITLVLGS